MLDVKVSWLVVGSIKANLIKGVGWLLKTIHVGRWMNGVGWL
jgi:hypothetical protein